MTKLLNLDEISPSVEKVLKLKGVEHQMKALSVEDIIENTRAAKRLEKNPDVAEEFELMVKMIGRSFPTIDMADLKALTLQHLRAIFDFVQEASDAENPQ